MVSEQYFSAIDASSGIYKAKLPRNFIPGAPAPVAAAALVKQQAGNGRLQWDFPWQHLTQAWIMEGLINHLQNSCSCGFVSIRDSCRSLSLLMPLSILCLARSCCPYDGKSHTKRGFCSPWFSHFEIPARPHKSQHWSRYRLMVNLKWRALFR